MRFRYLGLICLFALLAHGKDQQRPILESHNDIKSVTQGDSRTEDLLIFADGRVRYREAPGYGKTKSFEAKLSPQKLQRLTLLLKGKAMRAVPATIASQIKVLDGQWDKKLRIDHAGSQQTVVIENFYPLLNSQRPAYPKVLVELECMLQDIQRKAARRPAPQGDDDWCPLALGKR